MLRLAFLAPLFLLGCASPRTSALVIGEDQGTRVSAPSREPLASAPEVVRSEEVSALVPEALEPEAPLFDPRSVEPALAQGDESLHSSRFTLKGGYYGADEDTLDDGYIFNASWMRFFTRFFALEFEAGYMDVDGDESDPLLGNVDVEVWSVPLFVNGRLNAPLWILDVYGGAGLGTFYYDAEVSAAGASADDDGFLLAGNAFVGATINLADRIALGLEAKYYASEDIDDADEGLNGYALMLTVGFSR